VSGNFWANKLGSQTPVGAPVQPQQHPAYQTPPQYQPQQSGEWWLARPTNVPDTTTERLSNYVPGRDGPAIEELARMDASTLSGDALELIAAYKLKTNHKYDNSCPHCGAANGLMQASRNTIPRCVECGYAERQLHGDLQPLTKLRPGNNVSHARDFTGSSFNGEGFSHHSQAAYRSELGGPAR
jgi:hypothetical protein